MEQKTNREIIINEESPKILNDYLEAVRDDDKERISDAFESKLKDFEDSFNDD